jgi:hypothetical protein
MNEEEEADGEPFLIQHLKLKPVPLGTASTPTPTSVMAEKNEFITKDLQLRINLMVFLSLPAKQQACVQVKRRMSSQIALVGS